MRYCLCLSLFFLVPASSTSAQNVAISVNAHDENIAPELQYAHQIATRTPKQHPTQLAVYIGYWNELDANGCRDCSYYSRHYLSTGVRIIQSVSVRPVEVSFGTGLNREFLFARLLGTNDAFPNQSYRDHLYAIEGMLKITAVFLAPVFISTRLESKVAITEYANAQPPRLRIGVSYSFR